MKVTSSKIIGLNLKFGLKKYPSSRSKFLQLNGVLRNKITFLFLDAINLEKNN